MARAPTTFNLSDLYRALGVRDPTVIPNVEAGTLIPTVSLGEFRSFAPEVIEARGFVNFGPQNLLAGQWCAMQMLSFAPGGTIIETAVTANSTSAIWNMAPTKPFTNGPVIPFTMGGQPCQNLFEVSGVQGGAVPFGSTLGGTNTPVGVTALNVGDVISGTWVPPGWWFWATAQGPIGDVYFSWRFREMPTAQGPA